LTKYIIKGFHRQLRQVTTTQAPFPTDAALVQMRYLACPEAQGQGTQRVPNWGQLLGQLVSYFEDRLTPYRH
jgi:transposase-like protein